MVGLYFSGTGNTKHCVEALLAQFGENLPALAIENPGAGECIMENDTIVLGYPVYFSNLPKIMRDFLEENQNSFRGKKVYILATMGLFSGDGAGCAARLLKKYGAVILGGLHVKMPDSIGDERVLKNTPAKNREIIRRADAKIAEFAAAAMAGKPHRDGLSALHHIAGLLGQRLWFYKKTQTYKKKPNIDKNKCKGCGLCTEVCPMQNMALINGKAAGSGMCTLCYRCVGHCPEKALTVLGKKVYAQCLFEKY